jgi:predicted DNA-binding WGR domain protein
MTEVPENVPLYLIHDSGRKFWEVTLVDRYRHIRFGKLRDGAETGVKASTEEHPTRKSARLRAQELVRKKCEKGYSQLEVLSGKAGDIDLRLPSKRPKSPARPKPKTTSLTLSPSNPRSPTSLLELSPSSEENKFAQLISRAKEQYKGDYLELRDGDSLQYYQVAVYNNDVVEEAGTGINRSLGKKSTKRYTTSSQAVQIAKNLVRDKI